MEINATLPLVEPFSVLVTNLMDIIKYVVGGIFGIYVLSIFLRIYYNKKFNKRLKNIETNIEEIKAKLEALSVKKRK